MAFAFSPERVWSMIRLLFVCNSILERKKFSKHSSCQVSGSETSGPPPLFPLPQIQPVTHAKGSDGQHDAMWPAAACGILL